MTRLDWIMRVPAVGRRGLVGACVAIGVGCGRVDEPVTLRLGIKQGAVRRFHTEIETSLGGGPLGIEPQGRFTLDWTLTAEDSGDSEVLRLALRVLGASARLAPGRGSEASTPSVGHEPLRPPAPLTDGSIRLTLDSRCRLRGIEGLFSELLPEGVARGLAGGVALAVAERLARVVLPSFGFPPLPEKAVAPGEEWGEDQEIAFPPWRVVVDQRFEYLGRTVGSTAASAHRLQEDVLLSGEISLPVPGSGSLKIERGFAFGEVEIDEACFPLRSDIRWEFTLSSDLRAEADSDRRSTIEVKLKIHAVTTRVAMP